LGYVELIDGGTNHLFVAKVHATSLDLNEWILAEYKGRRLFGPDCMHLLAMLTSTAAEASNGSFAVAGGDEVASSSWST
jgi:hypothetical protein